MTQESWQSYSTALQELLNRPERLAEFMQDMDGSATADLRISPEMRTDLKKLLLYLQLPRKDPGKPSKDEQDEGDTAKDAKDEKDEARDFFEMTFRQIRRGSLITIVMSVLIFLMGLFLLGVAAVQSITRDEPATAIALASSGIVAIAAAFYRSPVEQVRGSAAEMQRSSMVLMSYMLEINLLAKSLDGRQTAQESELLTALTKDLTALLPSGERDERKQTKTVKD